MSAARLEHSLRVEAEALVMAARWGVEAELAVRAALLHDCAKGFDLPTLQRCVLEGELRVDKQMWDSRALLHAPVGAYVARRDYGEQDARVLDAIRWHTTGRANMSALEKIIYLADMIEPGRAMFAELPAIRAATRVDLDEAMRLALGSTVAYIKGKRRPVHGDTVEALRWYQAQLDE